MKISLIVPAFNEEKLLEGALAHIQEAACAFVQIGWEYELIVCDNNSTDRTAAIAQVAGAKVVFEPVNQISRARNRGAEIATGDWLVFVDADSHPSSALFAELAATIAGGDCLGGGCLVTMECKRIGARAVLRLWNGISRFASWAAGSFIFCEARAFRELGGFSLELFASEEIDFSRRLKRLAKRLGKRVVILRDNRILTSPRKLHLYHPSDYLKLLMRMVLGRGKALRDRGACGVWYDGRR